MKKSHGSALACMGAWRNLDMTLEDETGMENVMENEDEDNELLTNGWEESKLTNTGKVVLFFGCRNPQQDFLYESDWRHFQQVFFFFLFIKRGGKKKGRGEQFFDDNEFSLMTVQKGVLTDFLCAFSRSEKNRKIYVQDKIRENAQMVANLILKEHAYVYVCGDASAMAKDVETAIIEVLSLHSDLVINEARKYVNQMQTSGRYKVDIWSTVAPFVTNGESSDGKQPYEKEKSLFSS
ncbi:sulfite reductase (NADPH) flavoprotein alpha-component [Reticulomyxa filosa]|uniref:NADPH--hemoprotein reductase n=1 Tax=Reticulomyxa filosa TaxID=46433 RepID=X6N5Z6_RETFI|nr:sulfite reductase (NADPH) flavoprotein alpha-component [Reticulomyxa filosa]|eukprot:ETO21715.1 sulfite reductase (NADPH) flavoprotein alpha-component [Reticulomyxa filosa]